jgi:hypothetical protein
MWKCNKCYREYFGKEPPKHHWFKGEECDGDFIEGELVFFTKEQFQEFLENEFRKDQRMLGIGETSL